MPGSRKVGVALLVAFVAFVALAALVALVAGGARAVIDTGAEGRVATTRPMTVRVNGTPVRFRSSDVDRATLVVALQRVGVTPYDGVLKSAGTSTVLDPFYDRAVVTVNGAAVSMDTRLRRHAQIVVDNGTDVVEPTETRTVAIPYPNADKVALGWIPGVEGLAEEVFGTISGEVVSTRVLREPVGAREQVLPANVSAGSSVFLTFDDGPDPTWTLRVLDVLRAQGVRATFCMVGRYARAYPDVARRVAAEGHTLCNHTDGHARLDTLSAAAVEAEIQTAGNSIEAATGVRPTLFRFPYGRTSPTASGVVGRLGLRVLPWNVDPSDYTRPGTDAIIARVAQAVKPGSIVLLHDGGGDRSQTVAAITSLITSLRAAGYSFGTP
jgi:peptidoglycan/xylan/chitin deacetylase (PgdA/CDA1 family)